jgi:hypothetical protein
VAERAALRTPLPNMSFPSLLIDSISARSTKREGAELARQEGGGWSYPNTKSDDTDERKPVRLNSESSIDEWRSSSRTESNDERSPRQASQALSAKVTKDLGTRRRPPVRTLRAHPARVTTDPGTPRCPPVQTPWAHQARATTDPRTPRHPPAQAPQRAAQTVGPDRTMHDDALWSQYLGQCKKTCALSSLLLYIMKPTPRCMMMHSGHNM